MLRLSRKSLVRIEDHWGMALAVYHEQLTRKQQQKTIYISLYIDTFIASYTIIEQTQIHPGFRQDLIQN